MAVKKDNTVAITYAVRFEDGTEFDRTEDGKPFVFKIGDGRVLKVVEDAIIEMEKGQEKTITIRPENGYGHHNPELVRNIPRAALPPDREPGVGMVLGLVRPNGQKSEARITNVTENDVTVDLNHPLVGKTLVFTFKVEDVQ